MSNLTQAFLDQNELAAQTLTAADIDGYAEHHCGGLIVLEGWGRELGTYVKMHDSWADGECVVVHQYDPDEVPDAADLGEREIVEEYATGREALARFLALTEGGK